MHLFCFPQACRTSIGTTAEFLSPSSNPRHQSCQLDSAHNLDLFAYFLVPRLPLARWSIATANVSSMQAVLIMAS